MLELDSTTKKVLNIMSEEGITLTDALTFYGMVLNISGQFNNDPGEMVKNLEVLIKIPKKKKERINKGEKSSFQWVVDKIAKNFYKTSRKYEIKIVEVLKHSFVESFSSTNKGRFYLDSTDCIKELVKNSTNIGIFFVYLIIRILSEKPQFRNDNLIQNKRSSADLSLMFFDQLKVNKKEDILNTMIQQAVIDFSQTIYYFNHEGQNKLVDVLDSSVFDKIYMEYMAELEEETLKIWEEKEEERLRYSKNIDELQAELAKKEERIKELENKLEEHKNYNSSCSLAGCKILVVGDTRHKEGYREIIENYNGEFMFLDAGEEYHLVSEKTRTVDLVFHITAYGSHCVHFQLKKFKNVIYVNNAGLESFKRAVKKQFASANQCKNCELFV